MKKNIVIALLVSGLSLAGIAHAATVVVAPGDDIVIPDRGVKRGIECSDGGRPVVSRVEGSPILAPDYTVHCTEVIPFRAKR